MTTFRAIIYVDDGSEEAIKWCDEMFQKEHPNVGVRWWWWRVGSADEDRHHFFFERDEDFIQFKLAFSEVIKEYH